MKKVEDYVRSIPDFPEPGIIFRDVTSILQDADGLQLAIDTMQHRIYLAYSFASVPFYIAPNLLIPLNLKSETMYHVHFP